jgi:hypothetical protein
MALDVGRWWKYAQAKVNHVVSSSHRELDDLEAERELEVADKPWLRSDTATPSLDETRARIEAATEASASSPADEARHRSNAAPSPPSNPAETAEVAAAHLELDRLARESAARLDAIREELGVDPPSGESA